MAFKWPYKDPDETLDYSVDWSRYLGNATISTVTWYVETSEIDKTVLGSGQTLTAASNNAVTDSIQNVAQTNTNTVATINLGSGETGRVYKFTCKIEDSTGTEAERVMKIQIREN